MIWDLGFLNLRWYLGGITITSLSSSQLHHRVIVCIVSQPTSLSATQTADKYLQQTIPSLDWTLVVTT